MSHKSFDVPGKSKKKEMRGDSINISLSPQLFSSIILMIVFIVIGSYYFGKSNQTADYSYYDKFCEYITSNSTAYNGSSEKQMKEYYESWMNNTGFGDIIIGVDGELEDAFGGTEDIIQYTDVKDLTQGIYIYNDDEYSNVVLLSMSSLFEGKLTMIRANLDNCSYHTIFSTTVYKESDNKYKIHDSEDIYLEFTDYGTIIISDGEGTTYIDKYTLPDYFTGEYLPLHSF